MENLKLSHRKIYEVVADQIQQQITSGALPPGSKLPSTRELSESYGVGRSTVREALSALKAKGLLQIRQGEGAYVINAEPATMELPGFSALTLDKQTVMEFMEARQALESANAALAAEKRTEADLLELEKIINEMQHHLDDELRGEEADFRFHLLLAQATHNSIMVKMLETISEKVEDAIRGTRRLQMYSNSSVSARMWKDHKSIFEAIKASNPTQARKSMERHLQYVKGILEKHLK